MPEIGGKKLADDFRGLLGGMRRAMDEVKLELAGAATEFITEVRGGGKAVIKQIRADTDEAKRGFQELLGNEPPEVVAEKKPDTAGQVNGAGLQQGTSGQGSMPTQEPGTTGSNL